MSLDDGLGYEHTQSHAALVESSALVALVEALKDEGEILGRNTLSLVVDLDQSLTASARLSRRPGKAHAKLPSLGGELDGIIADIVQDLMDGVLIRQDEHIVLLACTLHVQSLLVDLLLEGDEDHATHLAHVEGLHIELAVSCLEAGHVQEGGDETGQAAHLLGDHLEIMLSP